MTLPIDEVFTKSDEEEKEFADWSQAVEEAFEALEEYCKEYEEFVEYFGSQDLEDSFYTKCKSILVKAGRR